MKIENGTIRKDGKRYDGSTWRKTGTNHTMNGDGLIFYKRKYRTLEGYLQQGGKLNKVSFNSKKPQDIKAISTALWNKEKTGYVYAITNPAWEGWIKIGMAVDAEDRLKGYQTSSPLRDFVLLHKKFFDNRRRAEAEAHISADKIAKERRGEWFKIDTSDAINLINSIDNTDKDGLQELKEVFNKKDKYGYYK
jgi:hypothetical protein